MEKTIMGRPPKFISPEEFKDGVEDFFLKCVKKGNIPTKGGLAIHLDTTRETLADYEKKEEYSDAVKGSYLIIEENWVQLLGKKGSNTAGAIFYLKNAFKKHWRDKQEIEVTETLTEKLKKS